MILVRFATLWFAVLVGFVALSLLKRRHPGLLAGAAAETARGEHGQRSRSAERRERRARSPRAAALRSGGLRPVRGWTKPEDPRVQGLVPEPLARRRGRARSRGALP